MKIIRSVALVALLVQRVLQGSAAGEAAPLSWPEAVSRIAGLRTRAEACVSLLKKYGDGAQIARGELTDASAKADSDAAIAGLIAALNEGDTPGGLPGLQTRLNGSATGLTEFCDAVLKLIPPTAGQKGVLADLAKAIPLEQLLKLLGDAISALYVNYRSDEALTRRTILTQLEAARWPAFSDVKAAP